MYESKRSLYDEASPNQRSYDPTSTIFEMAKNVALQSESVTVRVNDLEQRALMKGFTRKQVMSPEIPNSFYGAGGWVGGCCRGMR